MPGLQSLASAIVTPASSSVCAGRVGRPQAEAGRRKQHGDDAGFRQGPGVCHVGVHQMVGGGAAQFGGQRRPARMGQLLGVEAGDEAVLASSGRHPPGLVDRERAHVAEGVAALGQWRAHGQHLLDHLVDVAGLRIEVSAEKRRDEVDHGLVGRVVDRLEAAELGRRLEAVAGLHLDRGRPGVQGPLGSADQGGRELRERGRPGGRHGGHDPTRLVGFAPETCCELAPAISGEHEVGVGVDEARDHRPPSRVEFGEVAHPDGQARVSDHRLDTSSAHDDGGRSVDLVTEDRRCSTDDELSHSSIGMRIPRSRAIWRARS